MPTSDPRSPNADPRLWAIVPAAGVGRRMGGDIPKQYLPLGGRTVLEHSLAALDAIEGLQGMLVAVSRDDTRWPELRPQLRTTLMTAPGGAERADSVANALERLSDQAQADDWVLVHDAARPCLRMTDLERLIRELHADPVGGLLAVPVRDTMKQADGEQHSVATLDRTRLWHALTPQMFRFAMLRTALGEARAAGVAVTDEASAMEHAGHRPRLIEGHADNIKITRPEDLALAEFYLRQQRRL